MNRRHSLPAEVYALVERTPATVLLESGKQSHCGDDERPWTQLFMAPLQICAAHTRDEVAGLFEAIENAVAADQCAAGFFSYECTDCFEPKAATHKPAAGVPLAWFGIYERSFVFDHATGEFAGGEPPGLARLRTEMEGSDPSLRPQSAQEIEAEFALSEQEYARRIAAIHEWIRAGDVYQLNFTAPLSVKVPGSMAGQYAGLRTRQPVSYGAFLHWQEGRYVLSFSPELFFRVDRDGDSRRIVTRPMKGTAPRGRTTREDRGMAAWLQNDPKNRSENVMIVDLLRSDLGRVAKFGTVQTENLFAVERYATLWQMTSTVAAELRPEIGFHDIFRALFPCGSVTGAPKVRAMQLLAELEDTPRGVYTGAIGFFSPERTVFNVAIRTLTFAGGAGTFGAGSGVVIDSDAGEEFRECLLKAQFLTGPAHRGIACSNQEGIACSSQDGIACGSQADDLALIETMLWKVSYPFLEMHLDRLSDSADYFGFACDREAIRAALEQHARQFTEATPRRVRLLLTDADGNFEISSEPLAAAPDPNRAGRVCISERRTDPADAALYHKTTQRARYALAWQQASRNGFDDVLFLNLRGEVTEGAISNVFIEKDSHWYTPPIECGLLAGVYRRHLLETRHEIEERVLSLDDLRTADAVYLTNAVRGLRRVEVAW